MNLAKEYLHADGLAWLFDRVGADAGLAVTANVVSNAGLTALPGQLPAVEVTERHSDVGTFLFALNFSDEKVSIELMRSGREMLSGAHAEWVLELPPRGVAIVHRASE
jgi:hypothetical protein